MSRSISAESCVKEWMSTPVHSVHLDSTVREVLEMMKQERSSSAPVIDTEGQVVGIVTLGDIARVVLSTDQLLEADFPHYDDCLWAVDLIQQRLGHDKVTTLMSENVASVSPELSMQAAAQIMTDASIRHLTVVSDHQLVGVLSANDFVRMVASDPTANPSGNECVNEQKAP